MKRSKVSEFLVFCRTLSGRELYHLEIPNLHGNNLTNEKLGQRIVIKKSNPYCSLVGISDLKKNSWNHAEGGGATALVYLV